tara:strand:- start:3245 stop:5098 length:1854 start_codon:yes stop_codon:yes gene_type:complete
MEFNNKSLNISYKIYEILLFIGVWTYGLFGGFLTRADSNTILVLTSVLAIILCCLCLFFAHNEEKKNLQINSYSIFLTLTIFIITLILLNDGLVASFYNDQSAHTIEAFKHGIFLGQSTSFLQDYSYKSVIYFTNLIMLFFLSLMMLFFRYQKNIYLKMLILILALIFMRGAIIYAGGTASTHPGLRLFPIWISSILFGINELGIRIFQILLSSTFLVYCFYSFRKRVSRVSSLLLVISILTAPLFLFVTLSIEPSIYSFIIVTVFLIEIYNQFEEGTFSFSKWIFIISIGSLLRQSIFLLFFPLFIGYFLQKNYRINNWIQELLPFFISLSIFLVSIIVGTPSTTALDANINPIVKIVSLNYSKIFLDNLGILFSLSLFILLIPNIKKAKISLLFLITFFILFFTFVTTPFYNYEFTYRYHAEYLLPFSVIGLYIFIIYLEKISYNKTIIFTTLCAIIINIILYLSIFFSNQVTFKTMLANNFTVTEKVYVYLADKNYDNNFYYIGSNQRTLSKIIGNISVKNSIASTNRDHFEVGTFGTNLSFDEIDQLVEKYQIIIIDNFTDHAFTNHNFEFNTVEYEIKKHNEIVEYLQLKGLKIDKVFYGLGNFETLIFINE